MRWLRQLVNAVTGITLFGLLAGFLSGGKPTWDSDHGLIVFFGCRIPLARKFAGAMTFGDVVVVLSPRWTSIASMPTELLHHEMKHALQYNFTLGLPYFPLYWLACGYSWIVSGDHYSYNIFESQAGHRAGGYAQKPRRWH